jgi:sortase A
VTAVDDTTLLRSTGMRWPERLPRLQREVVTKPPGQQAIVASWVLTMLAVCVATVVANLVLVGQLQHFTAQKRLYGELREGLAAGSVPIGQAGPDGRLVASGTPLALLRIPQIGVDEVVVEGSSSSETMIGVGHRRDTPLPGQPGVSVLMGRAAAYGGVFGRLDELAPGMELGVQTGQGLATYRVIGVRTDTTMLPALEADDGRLTLITASGSPFLPDAVTRVDAELVSDPFPRPATLIAPGAIRDAENALQGDSSHAFALSWLIELLIVVCLGAAWAWQRWRRMATWIVFGPTLAMVGLAVAGNVATFFPNLM